LINQGIDEAIGGFDGALEYFLFMRRLTTPIKLMAA
jgi:hypothetical protein